ncbi:pentapeptide repeat-containing protein [Escherichia coli]|nr:pentapeptide repeat-containing protein [Escherichia coli]
MRLASREWAFLFSWGGKYPIDSDTLVTLQKFFEEDCTSHTGMSQTEDNINAVAMKITADIMQHAD